MKRLQILVYILAMMIGYITPVMAQFNCDLRSVAWHPVSDEFAFSCDNQIYIYTTEFELVKTLISPNEPSNTLPRFTELKWSPNGLYLAGSIVRADTPTGDGRASRLVVWDISTNSIILDIANRSDPIAWSPDSTMIAADSLLLFDALYFYEVSTGNEVGNCVECNGAQYIEWNPTNVNQFIASYSSSTAFIDPLDSNSSTTVISDISLVGNGFNADGTQIVFYNYENRQIEIRDASSQQILSSLPFTSIGTINSYHWLDNGIYIERAEQGAVLWDSISQQTEILPIDEPSLYWKPDGTIYISLANEGIFVQDTQTGNIKARFLLNGVAQVSSFTLIDLATTAPIPEYAPLANTSTIDIVEIGTSNLSLRANTNPSTVGSVVLDLNGILQTDDTAPYEFTNWALAVGSYTLTATPYSGAGGTGTAGIPLTINFTVVDSGSNQGGPDQILFSSVTDPFTAATNIFVINPDGTGQTQLTTGSSIKNFPAWSPDGSQILYTSNQDGDDEIFVMNADGSNPIQLTSNTALDRFPVWSPDGTQIAFASYRDGNWEIYRMDADGSNPVNLTNNAADDFNVSWSPDGSQIAFASLRDGTSSLDTEIYVMNADGTNVQRLTNSPSIDETPNWSPDGTQIAFTSDRSAGNIDIYTMNADGTNVQRLTTYSGTDEFPNWSPDGSQIAFDSNRSSLFNLYFDIHIMNANGTNVQRITTNGAFDRFAAWGYP